MLFSISSFVASLTTPRTTDLAPRPLFERQTLCISICVCVCVQFVCRCFGLLLQWHVAAFVFGWQLPLNPLDPLDPLSQ